VRIWNIGQKTERGMERGMPRSLSVGPWRSLWSISSKSRRRKCH